MSRLMYFAALFILFFLGLSASRASAALVCDTFASPPVVRGEGIAERVGDIRLTCTGGPPNALFTTTLFFFLNVNATNRLVSADSSALAGLVLTADNGTGPQPIAAPATLIGPSSVVFGGVSFRLSPTGSVTLQLAGLRAAANELMFATNSSIQVTLASNPNTLLSVPSTQLIVGTPEHGLYSAFSSKIVCGPRGSPLAVNPASFASFLQSGATFNSTRLTEGFPDAFGPLSAWQNLNADTGTRIIVNYSGLPAGARLFVPSVIAGSDAVRPTAAGDLGLTASGGQYAPGSSGSLLLSLVQFHDGNGAHGTPIYTPGAPGSGTVMFDGMSEVALYNGAGAAVYEVMDANPSLQESAQFPTFLSLPSFSGSAIETSETVSLAPLSTVETATAKDPLQRFEQVDVPPDCSIVGDCNAHYFPRLYVVESALNYSIPAGSSYQANYVQVQNQSGGVMQWTTSLKYLSGGSWLTISPASGVGNSTIRLDATPGSLAPGTYKATLTIDAGPIAGSREVPITMVITPANSPPPAPAPTLQSIVNAATFAAGPIAPGSIATIAGTSFAGMNLNVTFDGNPGKVLFSNATQINVIVPAALGAKTSTQVIVSVDGNSSAPLTATLAPFAPGIFANGILNQDYSLNNAQHPAAVGSVIQIFATGLSGSGMITAKIGGQAVDQPYYAGPAPGLAGVQQVDLIVPQDLTGATVQVSVCGATSTAPAVCSPAVAVALSQ
ncbi:MAG TPA: IPT/TIG domain-containing protein [Bryobacteraceae bacterium]|nr:IPT/TIG domain-containing protein [Bryobacteraceae bacterium]